MEWTSTYIRVYFFPRNAIPKDITAGNPDPSGWGLPTANYDNRSGFDCDIDGNYVAQKIVSLHPALICSRANFFTDLRHHFLWIKCRRRFVDHLDRLLLQDWLLDLRGVCRKKP